MLSSLFANDGSTCLHVRRRDSKDRAVLIAFPLCAVRIRTARDRQVFFMVQTESFLNAPKPPCRLTLDTLAQVNPIHGKFMFANSARRRFAGALRISIFRRHLAKVHRPRRWRTARRRCPSRAFAPTNAKALLDQNRRAAGEGREAVRATGRPRPSPTSLHVDL